MRIALGLEYCGADFQGWQSQKEGGTVQDALEGALACIAARPVATLCAGRTDAGVHATQQVVHFDTAAERPLSAWVRGVNAHLPGGRGLFYASRR
jgi:tRNA pseudouridine38-40 synthase